MYFSKRKGVFYDFFELVKIEEKMKKVNGKFE